MMVESSTELRWLERKRYHNGLAWDFPHPHKIGAKAGHPLCNEDDATVEECERPILSSTCQCSTYRRDSAPTSRLRDRGSREFESRGQLINLLAFDSTLSRSEEELEPPQM